MGNTLTPCFLVAIRYSTEVEKKNHHLMHKTDETVREKCRRNNKHAFFRVHVSFIIRSTLF